MVAAKNDNKELTSLFTRVGRIQFILLSLICSGFIFFGQPFISMWAGKNYVEAYPIALLLIIPVTIPLIQNLGIEIQKAKNMHQFRSWLYFFMAIGNLFVSIPLARVYGGVGAAAGTAASLLIGNGLIMNWYYHNKVGLDMRYFWKEISKFAKALLLPMAVGIVMYLFIDLYRIIAFLLCGSIYLTVFFISMWLFGMNQYEKDLIRRPVSRIMKRVRLNKV